MAFFHSHVYLDHGTRRRAVCNRRIGDCTGRSKADGWMMEKDKATDYQSYVCSCGEIYTLMVGRFMPVREMDLAPS